MAGNLLHPGHGLAYLLLLFSPHLARLLLDLSQDLELVGRCPLLLPRRAAAIFQRPWDAGGGGTLSQLRSPTESPLQSLEASRAVRHIFLVIKF
jgi:hypothetical protein